MGRNIHYTIISNLENALDNHSKVSSWEQIDESDVDDHYIYSIERNSGLLPMIVHLSDEYSYLEDDHWQNDIQEESFILIARPEATYDPSIVEVLARDRISIGMFGALMGALHQRNHWNYTPKERREDYFKGLS